LFRVFFCVLIPALAGGHSLSDGQAFRCSMFKCSGSFKSFNLFKAFNVFNLFNRVQFDMFLEMFNIVRRRTRT